MTSAQFDKFLTFIIVAAIVYLAFRPTKEGEDNLFLLVLASPVSIVYGLSLASGETVRSPLWVAGIVIAIIGMYCLFKVALAGLDGMKAGRRK